MKTAIQIALVVVATAFALNAMSQTNGTTVDGFPACISDKTLDSFTDAILSGDMETFNYYQQLGVCVIMKEGIRVYSLDYYDFLTKVEFTLQGEQFYTLQEGIKRD